MKKFYFFLCLVAIFILTLSATCKTSIDQPRFIKEQMEAFEKLPDARYAWSQPFGWGTGIYLKNNKEFKFLWCSWSNSDGYLQFTFNKEFDLIHLDEIKKVKDTIDRPWETLSSESETWETWVGTTNDWFFDLGKGEEPDGKKILDEKIEEFKRFSFIQSMEAEEYLK